MSIAQLLKDDHIEEAYNEFIKLSPLEQLFVFRLYKEAINFSCCKRHTYPFNEYLNAQGFDFQALIAVKTEYNLGEAHAVFNHKVAETYPFYLTTKAQFNEAFGELHSDLTKN